MYSAAETWGGLYAAFAAAGVSTLGLLSMAFLGDWGRRNSPYFSSFSVGFLLVAVFLHLVPDAIGHSFDAWRWILTGLGLMTLLGVILRVSTRRRIESGVLAFGFASIVAIGSHSFLDGVIYETSFQKGVFTGGLATFGLLLHEFPEGVIAFFILREAGMRTLGAGLWAFVIASLTTIAGAAAAALFLVSADDLPLSTLMGLTAGGLIYIIFFHLAPHASLTPHHRGYVSAAIGVTIALAAIIFRSMAGGH